MIRRGFFQPLFRVPSYYLHNQYQLPVRRPELRRFLFSSNDQTTTPTVEEQSRYLEHLLEMLNDVAKDPIKMNQLKLPRTLPFYNDTARLKKHLAPTHDFKFDKHVLDSRVNHELQVDTTLFSKLLQDLLRSNDLNLLKSYLNTITPKEWKIIRNTLLCKSDQDANFFRTTLSKLLIKVSSSNDPDLQKWLDPTFFHELLVPLSIKKHDYQTAIHYHKTLYPLIKRQGLQINWLPLILSSMLDSNVEGLQTLMMIHLTLDMKTEGFFDYIIPFLCDHCVDNWDLEMLLKWTFSLTKMGDLPINSDPHFTNLIELLLKHNYHRTVLSITHELSRDRNIEQVKHPNWASTKLILLLMEGVNFNQVKNPKLYLQELLSLFNDYLYIRDGDLWFNLIRIISFRDKDRTSNMLPWINDKMAQYQIDESYDIYMIKCIKAPDDDLFLKNFDTLLNFHDSLHQQGLARPIPSKLLGKFINILISQTSSKTEAEAVKALEEAFAMLQSYSLMQLEKGSDSQSHGFFVMSFELSKGFLRGLGSNKAISKYVRLEYLLKLENFTYDLLHTRMDNALNKLDKHNQRYVIRLELEIIKFKISIGQLEQSLDRLQKLMGSIGAKYQINRLDPFLTNHICSHLAAKVIENLKLVESKVYEPDQVAQFNNRIILKTLEILTQLEKAEPQSVSLQSWRTFLTTTAAIRPFNEIEYLVWWITRNIAVQNRHQIKLKPSHLSHPLSQIFSPYVISRLLKTSFTNIQKGSDYQPWKMLELLLKVSDVLLIHLDDNLIKKELAWGLRKLYVDDFNTLSKPWKELRFKNDKSVDEMVGKFNEIWIKTYYDQVSVAFEE